VPALARYASFSTPFSLPTAIPFGLGFLALWWAPPWSSSWAVALTVTLAFMLSDTLQTLVVIPYFALTAELTPDYDERTSITTYRMFFNLMASLVTAVAAPQILDMALKAGLTQQQGYLIVAALFGGLATIPFLLIFAVIREPARGVQAAQEARETPFRDSLRAAWANIPFRFAAGLYLLNWVTFDLVALMLPYYLLYWIAGGHLVTQVSLLGVELALESAVLGLLLIAAIAALPLWNGMAHRWGKRETYIVGMLFWAGVQLVLYFVPPGRVNLVLLMAVLAGLSVSTAHVMPEAIFPDVIEWDELRTGRRQDLGWFGYQTPPKEAVVFQQPPSALQAIRVLTGPMGAVLLLSAVLMAWFYPITRERHARIRRLLARRRELRASRERIPQ